MSTSKKIISINKRLNTIFRDMKSLSFEDINKILFNIELLKNKYLHRSKQGDIDLYEGVDLSMLQTIIDELNNPINKQEEPTQRSLRDRRV